MDCKLRVKIVLVVGLLVLFTDFYVYADQTDSNIQEGLNQYEKGLYQEAEKSFAQARSNRPDDYRLGYNLGSSQYKQGKYNPVNKEKYSGKHTPEYRSSWEFAFMRFCDNNPSVTQWASESIQIPYRHPLTGKNTIYVPDFFIVYNDKKQKRVGGDSVFEGSRGFQNR